MIYEFCCEIQVLINLSRKYNYIYHHEVPSRQERFRDILHNYTSSHHSHSFISTYHLDSTLIEQAHNNHGQPLSQNSCLTFLLIFFSYDIPQQKHRPPFTFCSALLNSKNVPLFLLQLTIHSSFSTKESKLLNTFLFSIHQPNPGKLFPLCSKVFIFKFIPTL